MIKGIALVFIGIFVSPFVAKWFNDFLTITDVLNNVIAGM